MKGKLRIFMIVCILATGLAVMWTNTAAAQGKYYVCLRNQTENALNYATMWCDVNGGNCTGWKNWKINPYSTMRHWGPAGDRIMHLNIHTGGSGGKYHKYSFEGSDGSCATWSTKDIQYNDRGYIRIYDAY